MGLCADCEVERILGGMACNCSRCDYRLKFQRSIPDLAGFVPYLCTGVVMVIISAYVGKARRAQRQVESKRIAELVQIALDTLRQQELAYHTDPVTAPQPYLSSLQLRDLILQDEHLIPTRRRLWDQVERVVEGNANVRANLEEVYGGDEMRVWRWVGSAGRAPAVRKPI